MPLPTGNIPWPPASEAPAAELYTKWGAWYSGDPVQLTAAYADTPGTGGGVHYGSEAELPRGQVTAPRFLASVQRGLQRMFWGTPPSVGQIRAHKAHVPLAGDIAATSADLMYGEMPLIRIPDAAKDNPAQQRLDEILDQAGAQSVLLEAAEIGAAFGGSYVRIRWDPILADCPLLDALPPDVAVPEWRGGRLVAVTFWRNLDRADGKWWRHLERHEPGRIMHGLFMSSSEDKLGRPMALADHDETAQFAVLVDPGDGQSVETGATGLTAEYFPNMRPHRTLRGSPLGRSDYAGVEPVLDNLDESWTSWMRDLRLGKGRVIVPRAYLQSSGRGKGAHFDAEREIFEQVDALTSPDGGLAMQVVQFEIRVEQHARTCAELTTLALRGAGYSAQTFGEQGDIAQTATEVTARESSSYRTRARKQGYAEGPLRRLARTLLEVDVAKFGTKGVVPPPGPLTVEWPDGVAEDPTQQAQTLQLLAAAEAASIHTRVAMLHPEWEAGEVDEEVARIKDDVTPPAPPVGEPGGSIGGSQGGPPAGPNGGKSGGAVPPPGGKAPPAAPRAPGGANANTPAVP